MPVPVPVPGPPMEKIVEKPVEKIVEKPVEKYVTKVSSAPSLYSVCVCV